MNLCEDIVIRMKNSECAVFFHVEGERPRPIDKNFLNKFYSSIDKVISTVEISDEAVYLTLVEGQRFTVMFNKEDVAKEFATMVTNVISYKL